MNICYLITVGILCAIGVSECLECFNCLNIADHLTCTNTSQCSNSESCYLQTLHSGNEVRYNMGCQNNQLCSSVAVDPNGIIGRSIETRQQYSCHECCSNNRCNAQLCVHSKPTSCIDDATLDCARLNSILNVCADVHHAKTICPKPGQGPVQTRPLPTMDSTVLGQVLSRKYARISFVLYMATGQIGPRGQIAPLIVV
ncbi:hypothetical protein DPMN_188930 [Dreissena polymorpha]|uniref:Sodefrin-like factor n=1 Tax=Dreissena polymorpha TaxID=45954 RepID=A0A9D4DTY6_DREPO|nr:hypothetical protein DPMN_188930 [Dreissena polymorpha]